MVILVIPLLQKDSTLYWPDGVAQPLLNVCTSLLGVQVLVHVVTLDLKMLTDLFIYVIYNNQMDSTWLFLHILSPHMEFEVFYG